MREVLRRCSIQLVFCGLIFINFSKISWALAPLESFVLGDFSGSYVEEDTDPLDFIFREVPKGEKILPYKKSLAMYRGLYEEGVNLTNMCKGGVTIDYPNYFEEQSMMRSFMATLQSFGLDITVRAIGKYAQEMEFSREDYEKLADNMLSYCSENISIISLKELEKNIKVKFNKTNQFRLPSIENNPLFTQKLTSINLKDKVIENEFLYTIKLFRTFCSWGGEADNARLLVPIIRHPVVASIIVRQMTNNRLDWNEVKNELSIVPAKQTMQVLCDRLICRQVRHEEFYKKAFRSVGSTDLKFDMERLYCKKFREIDYKYKDQHPYIKSLLKKQTLDDDVLLVSQFLALISGVPDFIVGSEKFSNGEELARYSLDESWDQWAETRSQHLLRELPFEEPLAVEKVDREQFFRPIVPKFKVAFDITLGEFDRIHQQIGKIKVGFSLNINKNFMRWIRLEWKNVDPRIPGKRKALVEVFEKHIADHLEKVKEKFIILPWKGKIETVIVKEILEQLDLYVGTFFDQISLGSIKIPVEFYYGPFALKQIHYRYKVFKNRSRDVFSTYEYTD